MFGDGARCLENAHRAADIVRRARAPRVAVATDQHHLVWKLASTHNAERVVDRLQRARGAIVANEDPRLHWPRSDVISERQSTLPTLRQHTATNSAQQFRCVAIADRHNRNVRNLHLAFGKPHRPRLARIGRRGRIAIAIQHAPALHSARRPHRAFGIDIAADEAVVLWIAVDDQRGRAVPLGLSRFDATKRAAVARDGDLAANRNAKRIELDVVLDQPVVDVDHFTGDIALAAVAVYGRILRQRRRRIVRQDRLAETQPRGIGRYSPDLHLGRVRHPDVICAQLGLESPRFHLCDDVVARARLRRGTGNMGLLREGARMRRRARRIGTPNSICLGFTLARR